MKSQKEMQEAYSNSVSLKSHIINICKTILYSDNPKNIYKAYNEFFTYLRLYVTALYRGNTFFNAMNLSCVEDVLIKIITDNDSIENLLSNEKYSPFIRLMSIMNSQNEILNNSKVIETQSSRMHKYTIIHIIDYLGHINNIEDTANVEKKKSLIKEFAHKKLVI